MSKHVPGNVIALLNTEILEAKITAILLLAHDRKRLVSYVDLAKITGEFSGGAALATALGNIMAEYEDTGLDLLPAIVSKTSGLRGPGEGFFTKAESLGYDVGEHQAFWLKTLDHLGYDVNDLQFLS